MRVFITGTAGFIGFHLARRLLADGHEVHGYDGMTPYYDVSLKEARLAALAQHAGYRNTIGQLEDAAALAAAADMAAPDVIVHLAAQAGVRYSLENPAAYASSNLTGTFNVLEVARKHQPQHLLIASTSSVYGGNTKAPFAETDLTDAPLTLYAATKKAGEAMSHSYAHLWSIPTTCFRFFTVYGPWGRPDMALFKFARAIIAGEPIEVYGEGRMQRDFTYVDDLVEAVTRLIGKAPRTGDPVTGPGVTDSLSPVAPWRVVNIAGGEPVELLSFIETLEGALGRKAERLMLPMQAGDVVRTEADPSLLHALVGSLDWTPTATGVAAFVAWYREWTGRSR